MLAPGIIRAAGHGVHQRHVHECRHPRRDGQRGRCGADGTGDDQRVGASRHLGGRQRHGVTIANLTIRDIYYHPIILNAGHAVAAGAQRHLINAGQQFVKSNPNPSGGGVDNGIVQYSVIEYETTSRDYYTNGVDVHTGRNWTIRHNLFRNIRAPQGQLAGPAILMWNASSGTIAEGNTFINCQREIAIRSDRTDAGRSHRRHH